MTAYWAQWDHADLDSWQGKDWDIDIQDEDDDVDFDVEEEEEEEEQQECCSGCMSCLGLSDSDF